VQAAATPSVSPRAAYAQRGITTLQHIFRDHFGHFAADYDSRYAKDLGNFRIERITRVATRFLTCGDYPLSGSGVYSRRESCQGVARIRCSNPECRHEYFRPFSCRGFHPLGGPLHRLCPSCSQKRSLLFAEYLDEQLLFALPHRQFVFTLPKALRVFLRYDPRLFGRISRLIFSLICEFYCAAASRPLSTAAVVAYQPFGDALRFNPHFHSLILEGGFDSKGQFYYLPIRDTTWLAQLLRWRHSGFSVDNSVRLDGDDHTARQALAQYIARAPLSLQKLTYDRTGAKVLYHTSYNPYFKQNTNLWSAPDFIAHLTQFIPPLGSAAHPLLRVVLLSVQGTLAGVAPHPARCSPGVAPVPHGASACAARPHGAHHGAARRLPLSLGEADREGV
jgi:hypothetical protein